MSAQIDALRAVLADEPQNHPVRQILADLLTAEGRAAEAVAEFLQLHRSGVLGEEESAGAAQMALSAGLVNEARQLLDTADGRPDQSGADPTPSEEQTSEPHVDADRWPEAERVLDGPAEVRGEDFIDSDERAISFTDVGGLADVKKVITRLIIQPLANPDLFARYGKKAGGGVLLYGPPGCGKTLIARATAGEVGLPFYNLRIEDIVDPYFGVSERRLAEAFEAARELRPCIVFIDELDAMGYARSQQNSDRGRALVEVLLQQLDSIGSDNDGLLVLAASNEPWDIDGALLRPGRFDRTIFVPPPDEEARRQIIEHALAASPSKGIKVSKIVKETELFSGADLRELLDRSLEEVLDTALETNTEPPLTQQHLDTALAEVKPTTLTWLHRARNHADFGNIGGRWDDLQKYLKKRSIAKRLRLPQD